LKLAKNVNREIAYLLENQTGSAGGFSPCESTRQINFGYLVNFIKNKLVRIL